VEEPAVTEEVEVALSLIERMLEESLKMTPVPAEPNVIFPVITPPAFGRAALAILSAEFAVEFAVLAIAVVAASPSSRSSIAPCTVAVSVG
jgi:hypothetical protein